MRGAAEELGGIDVVVSNVSALAIPDTEENWEASLNVDVMGTVRLVKAALPYLEASEAACILAISSVSGREVDFAAGPYGTAKAALVHYMSGLAFQLARSGSGPTRSRRVTHIRGRCLAEHASRPTPSSSPRPWRSTPPAGWVRRPTLPAPWCSWPARCRAGRPVPTWWWTAP